MGQAAQSKSYFWISEEINKSELQGSCPIDLSFLLKDPFLGTKGISTSKDATKGAPGIATNGAFLLLY